MYIPFKAAPSTHSGKSRLLLAIYSNFTNNGGIKYSLMIALLVYACMLLLFSEINKINMNYFEFRFDRFRSKLCTKPNYENGAFRGIRFRLHANEAWGRD